MKKLLWILIVFNLMAVTPCFAQNRIDYDVSQQEMLQVVYSYIHGTNTLQGTQYYSRVFCSPLVYLEAGNCYIDWFEYRYVPYNKETAYQAAVQRYSLTAHTGTYDIEYQNNKVIIRLRNKADSKFYQGQPYPTPNSFNYGSIIGQKSGGVQIPTTFEYNYNISGNSYSTWFYISNYPNYWTNCALKKQELERQGFTVVRYYPTNGMQDLRNYYIPGPTG